MNKGTAAIIKRKTANGCWTVKETIPLGKLYVVDLDSRRTTKYYNFELSIYHTTETIDCQDVDDTWLPIPTELLKLNKKRPKAPK